MTPFDEMFDTVEMHVDGEKVADRLEFIHTDEATDNITTTLHSDAMTIIIVFKKGHLPTMTVHDMREHSSVNIGFPTAIEMSRFQAEVYHSIPEDQEKTPAAYLGILKDFIGQLGLPWDKMN